MIRHQEEKVLKLAKEINPNLTPEDLMNPEDFPELERHGRFNFEDGILAGLKSLRVALRRRAGGPLPIYMDHHATTPLDPRVLEEMLPFLEEDFGNAASREHVFGQRARRAVEKARGQIASLINADPEEIIFTSGATESNNLALKGVTESCRDKGNHIITVVTEHKAVLDPCKYLEGKGYRVTYLAVNREGLIDLDRLSRAVGDKTILISVMAAHNEIGVIQPIEEIGKIAQGKGILFHSDAAQAVGKIPVDVKKCNVDILSFSAHKMYGPKGIGVLWVRRKNPKIRLAAQIHGGGHEQGLRSGTLNVPGIVGFGKACEIAKQELPEEIKRIAGLRDRLLEGFRSGLGEICVNGSLTHRLPVNLNVSFPKVEEDSLIMALQNEIAVSSGSACDSANPEPSYVLKAIGLSRELARNSIRFGLGRFNTAEEVDFVIRRVVQVVKKIQDTAGRA